MREKVSSTRLEEVLLARKPQMCRASGVRCRILEPGAFDARVPGATNEEATMSRIHEVYPYLRVHSSAPAIAGRRTTTRLGQGTAAKRISRARSPRIHLAVTRDDVMGFVCTE